VHHEDHINPKLLSFDLGVGFDAKTYLIFTLPYADSLRGTCIKPPVHQNLLDSCKTVHPANEQLYKSYAL